MRCSLHYITYHKVTFHQWIAEYYTNKRAIIQPHALNTSFALYLTKSYTTTQLMLTPHRCTPSQVANNPHSWESGHFPVKQFITQGKLPFTQAYQMSFIISKHFAQTFSRISHHTHTLTEQKTGSIVLISPSVPQGGSACLGQCTTSKCLLAAPHLQCLLTQKWDFSYWEHQNFSMQYNTHTVLFST